MPHDEFSQCKSIINKMRVITIITFLCVLVDVYGHDLILGMVSRGDVILFRTNEYKHGFPFFVRESIVEYPPDGEEISAMITAILVKDNDGMDYGGYVKVNSGGIGQRFVSIELKSQRGNRLNFNITIYGKYYF